MLDKIYSFKKSGEGPTTKRGSLGELKGDWKAERSASMDAALVLRISANSEKVNFPSKSFTGQERQKPQSRVCTNEEAKRRPFLQKRPGVPKGHNFRGKVSGTI